ncbi:MAG: transcription termination factor Rho [Trueperaceae bacterium]
MSPRAKKQDEASSEGVPTPDGGATQEAPKKRRGRPRKADVEAAAAEAAEAAEAQAPTTRRRRKKADAEGGDGNEAAAATGASSDDATGSDGAEAGQDGGAADGGATSGPDQAAGSGGRRGARSARGEHRDDDRDDDREQDEDDDAGDDGDDDRSSGSGGRSGARGGRGRGGKRKGRGRDDDGDDGGSEASDDDADDGSDDDGGRGGSRRRGSRRQRSNQQRVNYRDLQGKIVPELHLMAKEAGLEDYRTMEKDELAIAILDRLSESEGLRLVQGYLEISSDGYGFLQESLLKNDTRKVIVSAGLIKQFRLRTGDWILGKARPPRNNERYGTLIRVEAVNGVDPFQASKRPRFDDLTPTFPETRIALETTPNEPSARVIDLLAPIGRGQRGLIVAPPKAGKTTLLKSIAHSVVHNEPDLKLIVLLVDERPEEVTDFRESVQGVEVVASTFDEPPTNHIRVAEFVHERARRIVEEGGHVMILLDSITRLARANNLVTPPTGRTLSGGLDSNALHWPKRFLGAARNIRGGGSLSILATALVETGSRMDDVIFEEFKGTGNMELHLSRRLEERRIFPAIDILKSGTRREDLLLGESILAKMWLLRKVISDMDAAEAMEMLLSRLSRTKTNEEFLSTLGQG